MTRQLRVNIHAVEAAPGGALALTVGLNLAVIDEPAIRKTLIMVRNYKRLGFGRHEWGEVPT